MNPLASAHVTNVVNLRPKTLIFGEKAIGLTTFVTTRIGASPNLSTTKQTTLEGPEGTAGVPMGGNRAWPDNEPTRRTIRQHTRPHWCGGRRRDLPRCRWAVAGPGRASRRRAERSSRRGRLAGGPPPTGTHSGRGLRRPQHPWGRKQRLVSYNRTSRYAQESIRRPRPAGAGRGQRKCAE